jgi:hypothetical protein
MQGQYYCSAIGEISFPPVEVGRARQFLINPVPARRAPHAANNAAQSGWECRPRRRNRRAHPIN